MTVELTTRRDITLDAVRRVASEGEDVRILCPGIDRMAADFSARIYPPTA